MQTPLDRPLTIARLAAEFLDNCNVDPKTLKGYQSKIARFCAYCGSYPIVALDAELISAYLATRNDLAVSTHRAHRRVLSTFCRYLVGHGHLASNPVEAVPVRKPDRSKGEHVETESIRYLSDEQLALLHRALASATHISPRILLRLQLLIVLIYRSGCRVDEILSLDRDRLDLDQRCFTVIGKGNKKRICYFASPDAGDRDLALSLLSEWLEHYHDGQHPSLLLAEHRTTGRITRLAYRTANDNLKALIDPIPELVDISLHMLRHTYATERVGTMALEELQALLGHADIATTQRYAKVTPKRAASVAKAAIERVSKF